MRSPPKPWLTDWDRKTVDTMINTYASQRIAHAERAQGHSLYLCNDHEDIVDKKPFDLDLRKDP